MRPHREAADKGCVRVKELKSNPTVADVREFWNDNPLFTGEGQHEAGTLEWFEEHRRVVIDDCLAGRFDDRTLPPESNRGNILDLGCGPGFWTIELQRRCRIGAVTSADLTPNALELTRRRLDCYGLSATLSEQNAEALTFADGSFDHVNCQGVVHHTPDTAKAVSEIARVLRSGGTASISVYYRNALLRAWRWVGPIIGPMLVAAGGKLEGRGRENIHGEKDVDTIVRLYDGAENPIGKAYDRRQFVELLSPHFDIDATYFHFFPARSLPLGIPKSIHRLLDAKLPFMIYANATRR